MMGDMGLMGLMGSVLVASLLTGCFTSWVWCFVNKWEVSEDCTIAQWMQVHGNRFVSGVAQCPFCFNWWLAWVVVIMALMFMGWWWMLAVPFFSTTVGRMLSA